MTLYSFDLTGCSGPVDYVRATDLREKLKVWEDILRDVTHVTAQNLACDMLDLRLSLHCEPEMPPPVHKWRGRRIKDMSRLELLDTVEEMFKDSDR